MRMASTFKPNPDFDNVRFLLGSKSPRRRELIQMIDVEAVVVDIDADEDFDEAMPQHKVAQFLAEKKSNAFKGDLSGAVLITADTTVLCNNVILNKPENREEAMAMLGLLSGTQHEVHTGVCLRSENSFKSFSESTRVFFRTLSDDEISYYVDEYKPFDKAGAYGIQEWIGGIGIERIEGSYYNVMGLPTSKLYSELCEFISRNF